MIDRRTYSGIGGVAGLGLSILLLNTLLQYEYLDPGLVAASGIGMGTLTGRLAAAYKWRHVLR
jgi:hypothetical protein